MKYITILSLAGAISASAIIGGEKVFAAEKNATSQTNLAIKAPAEPTLTLDSISSLDFGEANVAAQSQEIGLKDATTNEKKSIQVTDVRGTGAGWKVSIQISEFKGTTNPANRLKGAELRLPAGTLTTQNDSNIEGAPETKAVKLAAGGPSQLIFQAATDQGMGMWADQWDKKAIILKIPSAPKADRYTATLTATLTDTPA